VKEWLKRNWKLLAIAGAGSFGLWLLTQRGGATPSSAGSDLPDTGPPRLGNQTPATSFFSPSEEKAAQLSTSERFLQLRQAQDLFPMQQTARNVEHFSGSYMTKVGKAGAVKRKGNWASRLARGVLQFASAIGSFGGPTTIGGGKSRFDLATGKHAPTPKPGPSQGYQGSYSGFSSDQYSEV
jgi:hypothetical protein